MPIVNRIAEFEAELIEWRHQLHKFPELGFEEYQTAEFIAEKLTQMGLDVNRGLAGTGVVATLTVGSGNGPKIGLRADMDALPILERSDFEHASKPWRDACLWPRWSYNNAFGCSKISCGN